VFVFIAAPTVGRYYGDGMTTRWPERSNLSRTRRIVRLLADSARYLTFPMGSSRGVFDNFRDAARAAPKRALRGYDHQTVAAEFREGLDAPLNAIDFPLLFHLPGLLRPGATVLDFGGAVGTHYLRYRTQIPLDDVRWVVWDLPAMVAAGRDVCADFPNVTFVTDVADTQEGEIDVFLASGSLQYVDPDDACPIAALLAAGRTIRYLLVHRMPLGDGPTFVTLQSAGVTCYPQVVYNRAEFISRLEALGFRKRAEWEDSTNPCPIPFHRSRSLIASTGLLFERSGA